jgi:hypothetical protein
MDITELQGQQPASEESQELSRRISDLGPGRGQEPINRGWEPDQRARSLISGPARRISDLGPGSLLIGAGSLISGPGA